MNDNGLLTFENKLFDDAAMTLNDADIDECECEHASDNIKDIVKPVYEDTGELTIIGRKSTLYERIKDLQLSHNENVLAPFEGQREWDLFKFIHDSSLTKAEIEQLLAMECVCLLTNIMSLC